MLAYASRRTQDRTQRRLTEYTSPIRVLPIVPADLVQPARFGRFVAYADEDCTSPRAGGRWALC